ncbi:ABC transporter permease [Planctomycetota bacterium]
MPDGEVHQISELPQVVEVMPVKLLMTSCGSTSDMIAIHGVDKEQFTKFRNYIIKQDELELFRNTRSGALAGDRIAARYGWKVGQQVTLPELRNISFTVNGIFTTNGTTDDFLILMGRKFVQEASNEQGISNHVLVKLKPEADPTEVKQAIDNLPFTIQTSTQPEQVHLSSALGQLTDLVEVSKVVIAVIIVVILIAMGNAMSMTTRERSREFGIMRTLGFRKKAILLLVISEGVIQTALGGIIGCAAVQIAISARLFKTVSACGFNVNFIAGPYVWVVGLAMIITAGILGSLVPAYNISTLDVVTAIARED